MRSIVFVRGNGVWGTRRSLFADVWSENRVQRATESIASDVRSCRDSRVLWGLQMVPSCSLIAVRVNFQTLVADLLGSTSDSSK